MSDHIRDEAIKTLLYAQKKIAEKGSASEIIAITKFIFKFVSKHEQQLSLVYFYLDDEDLTD